ncbi:MAG: ZPR1 zinc finger domain-containing protein [Candidatus Odinarchaeia archaeon]
MADITSKTMCPVCKKAYLTEFTGKYTAPYIGDILIFTIKCDKCGFKRSEILPLQEKEPSRYMVKVEAPCDLYFKVLRSTTGFVRIPEYGVSMEPGIAAQPFITNIEGILLRFLDAVKTLKNWEDAKEKKERCVKLIERIKKAISGEDKFTLIVEDPLGNSAIFPYDEKEADKIVKTRLTKKEIDALLESLNILRFSGSDK